MTVKLTTTKKKQKIELAIKIMGLAKLKSITIAKASKHYLKDRRFLYDVNRRWINKNNSDIDAKLIQTFKENYSYLILSKNLKKNAKKGI